jgi:hypothetical protein
VLALIDEFTRKKASMNDLHRAERRRPVVRITLPMSVIGALPN